MKNKIRRYIRSLTLMGILGLLSLWVSCTKSEDTSPPTIANIRAIAKDSSISSASAGSTIAIVGTFLGATKKVFFNDFDAYINPAYLSDDVIVIQIPENAPYRSKVNKVRVETAYGTAEKVFSLNQPGPTITSFVPTYGSLGDTITIAGADLDNVKNVLIGITPVTVIGGTDKELKVKITEGDPQGLVTVTTIGGSSKSVGAFGFSLVIFDDVLKNDFWAYEWSAVRDMVSTEFSKKGKSIKIQYTGGYAGFGVGNSTPPDIKKYKALKMSIYLKTDEPEARVKFGIKDKDGKTDQFSKILVMKPGWNEFILDFKTDLKSPDRFGEFQIQEWGNTKLPTLYIDDLGLL